VQKLIWLNPLLRYQGFEARPAACAAMLPHVDEFLPVHNVASLIELAGASRARTNIAARRDNALAPRRGAFFPTGVHIPQYGGGSLHCACLSGT